MIREGSIIVKSYGGLEVRPGGVYSHSGSGGTPPKKPKKKTPPKPKK